MAPAIEELLAHHNAELEIYRKKTGGRFVPHKWPDKIRKKIRVELKERGVEDGVQDFKDAICGLFRSDWHTSRNNLTIQSVLNGTQLDRLADEYRNAGAGWGYDEPSGDFEVDSDEVPF